MSEPLRPGDRALERLLAAGAEPEDPSELLDGRYRLGRELGRGGMGVVREAFDVTLERRVAIKFLSAAAGWDAIARQRFVHEALAVARIQHPHIAAVFDATPDWMAMQLIDGRTLADESTDATPIGETVTLLRDAAMAVQAAHDCGVVHRDLKPQNLMVQRRGSTTGEAKRPHVFVMDFGLAKAADVDRSVSTSGSILGTPEYMAPEQASPGHVMDARTDVYGLGATLYAALANRPPVEGDSAVDVIRRVSEGVVTPLRRAAPRVPGDLANVVHRALAREPERRYPSAAAFADDLDRWLRREPVLARPPSVAYRTERLMRRHATSLKVAGALALLMGVALLLVWVQSNARVRGAREAFQVARHVDALLLDGRDALLAGRTEVHTHKLAQAEAACLEFLERSGVAEAHYLLGVVRARMRRPQKAIESLDAALELDPELEEARFLRGLTWLDWTAQTEAEGGPPSLAIGHYLRQARNDLQVHRSSSLAFRRVDVLYGEARLALLEGREDEAKERLSEIVFALEPFHIGALRTLAEIAQRNGDDQEAAVLSSRAMDVYHGRGWTIFGMLATLRMDSTRGNSGPTFGSIGLPEALRAPVAKAHKHMREAHHLRQQGHVAEAITAWSKAAETLESATSDNHAGVWNDWAIALTGQEELRQSQGQALQATSLRMRAIEALVKALAIQDLPAIRTNLGDAWRRHADHLDRSEMSEDATRYRQRAIDEYHAALEACEADDILRDALEARLAALR